MAQVLEGEFRFPPEWKKDDVEGLYVLNKGDAGPSYAVREVQTEQGSRYELLTKQTDQTTGEVKWMPAKTPCRDYPERVVKEAEYRQNRIGRSWQLDGDSGVLVHKDGTFGARLLEEGKLELLTRQKGEWAAAKKPFVGTPEAVFKEAGKRQFILSAVNDGKMLPPGWNPGRDHEGKAVGIHPEGNYAVRSAGGGKLELLTPQMDKNHKWGWQPAKEPHVALPGDMYKEISRRQYGINMGKQGQVAQEKPVEKAQQQTKAQARAKGKSAGKGREL